MRNRECLFIIFLTIHITWRWAEARSWRTDSFFIVVVFTMTIYAACPFTASCILQRRPAKTKTSNTPPHRHVRHVTPHVFCWMMPRQRELNFCQSVPIPRPEICIGRPDGGRVKNGLRGSQGSRVAALCQGSAVAAWELGPRGGAKHFGRLLCAIHRSRAPVRGS